MKMLFFSSEPSEVKQASKDFTAAGILCEIRNCPFATNGVSANPAHTELWIRDDKDCHRAFLLCVQLGIGFAKRAGNPALVEH
jgi:hypothetical protein